MSRKAAIIVLASLALTIVLSVGLSKIPFTHIDPDSMPSCTLTYTDQYDVEKQVGPGRTGYHWKMADPSTNEKIWDSAGPDNFFTMKYGMKEILPGDLEVTLQIVWLEPPENIVIKRWPLTEWTPNDFEAIHSDGEGLALNWKTIWKKTKVGFDVERGSLYGVWIYYGDEWVEYSFIVPEDDPTDYDYLGYFGGFDDPGATQFTLDTVEWISLNDTERIEELKLNPDDDMPSGFYIYNPSNEAVSLSLTDQTKFTIIDPETGNSHKTVDKSEFLNYLNQLPDFGKTTLFLVDETDGNVKSIKEHYVP